MRICFFSGNIARTGGTERVALLIANELSKRGYDIRILSFEEGLKTGFEVYENIVLSSLHLEDSKGFFGRKIVPYIRLFKYLNNEKPNVLINIDVLLCLYSLPLKLFTQANMIAWEHFNYRSNNGVKNRDRARKLAARLADEIVVLTKADLEEYSRNLRIKHHIDYIYNPAVGEICDIDYKAREHIVVASGRLSYPKNFLELLEIWRIIEQKNKDWKLVICGSGEEESELKEFVCNNKLENVVFAGFVTNIEEYYKKAKIMVMTSRYEGFPMVLLEGQKVGLPIVSYDCFTGPGEIVIDGVDGYLVRQGDRENFISKLEKLMDNEDLLMKFSQNALIDSKRFDINEIVDKWESVFLDKLC